MKISEKRQPKGFTLLEMILVLVLVSVALALSTLLIETTVRIALTSKHSGQDSQKIQVAINRLVKEFKFADHDTIEISNNGQGVEWTSKHPDRLGEACSISWDGLSGSDLEFSSGGQVSKALLDHVGAISISSSGNAISITLVSSRSEGVEHSATVHPR